MVGPRHADVSLTPNDAKTSHAQNSINACMEIFMRVPDLPSWTADRSSHENFLRAQSYEFLKLHRGFERADGCCGMSIAHGKQVMVT